MQISPLHQSTIKSYLWCGRSFKYQYIDCIPPAFRNLAAVHGTLIHKIIHLMHTVEWEQDVQSVYPVQFLMEEQSGIDSHIPIFFRCIVANFMSNQKILTVKTIGQFT
ncbi:MAG: PD-(D/E)XK nuclease family protein [Candidatus Electryonea clarkiae]|nr:PD-(D/E)XK nuclease family protein [Candidatus Electryonea clarkiae]MDP8285176.1 PD-(D/E)XK nuclease family protein [Candidatus Electryonea clarkiae]